ncbi:DUF4202 domain-containing protein [Aestuariivivens sediminicola]|uniref:DUF4202 domain-containing protein n=1 Tax=Aestuariivivens sediminicola TaxID=2913560 RepID=UPI001F577294|nr:DUF4202 domain-containing protein [Aestuariivivens sediminicola]
MKPTQFESALALIDKMNGEDPNTYEVYGIQYSKELLYSERMSRKLLQFNPMASEALQISARAQHLCRWKIPRDEYPMNRIGYLKWREALKRMHVDLTNQILERVGVEEDLKKRIGFLISKKGIKKDEESQCLEDVICLVFLEYYFEEFASKHPDNKVIEILQKTWRKMSQKGQEAALQLQFSARGSDLIKRVVDS